MKLKFIEERNNERVINNIKHLKVSGKVINDEGIETQQDLNIITKDKDSKLALWSMFDNGNYRLGHVLEIAEDFENKNKDYKVLAAINADYFYMRDFEDVSVNANVIFKNKILNSRNHSKYQALKFNENSKYFEIVKETIVTKNLVLSVYEEGILIDKQEIHYNNLNENLVITDNLNDEIIGININDTYNLINHDLFYLEGNVTNDLSKYKIISKNNYKLTNNQTIKIQYEIINKEEDEMLVGFDGVIIKDNKVLEFNEMTGQSEKHNKDRHPRSAIGINKEGNIAFCAVDGRLEHSIGVDNREFAKMLNDYGIVDAYNLDGGGSTQVILRVNDKLTVINTPSELPLRPVTNALLIIVKK